MYQRSKMLEASENGDGSPPKNKVTTEATRDKGT